MKRPILTTYQLLIGVSDTATGALLMVAPQFTLHGMGLHAPDDALTYLSFIGAFVFSVGAACLYGAKFAACDGCTRRLETVWLLTAITRAAVAIFVTANVVSGVLALGWMTVAVCDAGCAAIQSVGLRRGWLNDAAMRVATSVAK
jgi:hypothetical protein